MSRPDFSWSYSSLKNAADGIKGHLIVQNNFRDKYADMDSEYLAEAYISYTYETDEVILDINGRIDGIIVEASEITIHEIKTIEADISKVTEKQNELHWAQLKCYAYIYAKQNSYSKLKGLLTYYNRNDKSEISFSEDLLFEKLESFFNSLVYPYIGFAAKELDWKNIRDISIKALDFPYNNYRKGQRQLAVSVYRAITNKLRLFAQAPTGTGKTLATLFPAIKAIGEGEIDRVFYLTAKTITRTVAQNTFLLLKQNGLLLRTLVLTAKEKICFSPETPCEPEYCQFLKNLIENHSNAINDILQINYYDRQTIESYALKYDICPFEFSLELALYCELIICDYNYLFDPRVSLKRFFTESNEKFCFLVDEAHNLVDRAREMYSTKIIKSDILNLRKKLRTDFPSLYKKLTKINTVLLKLKKEVLQRATQATATMAEIDCFHESIIPKELVSYIEGYVLLAEQFLDVINNSPYKDEFLEVFFNFINFIKISELYDDRYTTLYYLSEDFVICLYCLDPSRLLHKQLSLGKSSILFSATLTPLDYYKTILGGRDKDATISLTSPFPPDNLKVLLQDKISTRYSNRHRSYKKIADIIADVCLKKTGNYLVFFPSFKYMNDVIDAFLLLELDVIKLIQENNMNEQAREEFLNKFETVHERSLIGFAVMGGIFGEGIDLTGDKLSGVVIVGVGLPQICFERNIIMDYFNKKLGSGFEYSYTYPGINRVLQAAGRVIRTETDKGFVVLIDDRFGTSKYKSLFPKEWKPISYQLPPKT